MLRRTVALALVAAVLLSAAYVLTVRSGIEAGNRAISLIMDGPDIVEHAAMLEVDPADYMLALREAGLFAVLVPYDNPELRTLVTESGLGLVLLFGGELLPSDSEAYDTTDSAGVCFPDADTPVEFVLWPDLNGKVVFLLGNSATFRGYMPSPAQTAVIERGIPAVRTFRISRRETDAPHITPDSMTYRWQMSIREFNTKALLARPFYDIGMDENADYVRRVVSALSDDGYSVGLAEPLADFYPGPLLTALLTLGVGAVAVLLIAMLRLPVQLRILVMGAVVLTSMLAMLPMLSPFIRLGMALVGAIAASCLGIIWAAGRGGRRQPWWLVFIAANALTIVASLVTAALLSNTDFFFELNDFRGVKLQYIVPVLLVCAYSAVKVVGVRGVREALKWPLWVKLSIGAAGLAVMAMYFLRVDTALGSVSQLELAVREAADKMLLVRPRFKELVGHPLLMVSLYYRRQLPRAVFALGLIGATIGQISIVNTFMHLRTPLVISIIRVGHGLWIGALLGLLAVLALKLIVSDKSLE